MSLINSGNGIIGIDYSEMNRVKSNLKSARDRSTDLNRKINTVITKLQVDKGSSRIKMATDQLRDYSRQVTRMQSDMESTINKVDRAIRRFKEVDSACAARIRAVGGNESEKKSFFEEAEEGLVSIGGKIEGELGDVLEEGTKVFEGLTGFASEWVDKHPLAMDVIGAVVEVAAIVLTVAAITASAPALAIVGAVIGVVLAANSLIDEGTKIYNNLRNGSNAGFNAIESGFKEVLGNKVGEVAYEVVNIAGIVVSLPSALRGGVEILSGVKNIIKEGSLIEEGEKIFTTLKESTGDIGNSLKTIKQIITGEKSIALSVLDTGTGVRIPNVSVIDNDINSISKMEEVSGGGNSLEGRSKAVEGGFKSIQELVNESTCNKDELYNYLLKNVDSDAANAFLKEGIWQKGIQIPKNSSVLNADGSINWSKAAEGGYTLDTDGMAIKENFAPKIGETIDRYGNTNGRYTSPVINEKPYSYAERSLPYVEDLSNYHQYEVMGDFSKIEEYVNNCSDVKLKTQIDATVTKYYDGDYSKLISYKGEIAEIKGWGNG